MFDDGDLEIFAAFVEEGAEMMDDVEPQLVELEQNSVDSGEVDLETINSIFRLFHSMKGSAGFLELNCIVKLTHRAENLLDIFRKEQGLLRGSDVTLLLQTIDVLRKVMDDLVESGKDDTFSSDVDELVAKLQHAIETILNPDCAGEEVEAVEETVEAVSEAIEPEDPGLQFPKITITPEMHAKYMEEAEELLDSSEQDLLQALNGEEGQVDLAEALRCLHSFKGNSGFMGYTHLEKLTHITETTLEKVVEGEVTADEAALNIFLRVVDALRKGVGDLSENGSYDETGLISLGDELNSFLKARVAGEEPAPVEAVDTLKAADPAPKPKGGFIPLAGMKKSPKTAVAKPVAPVAAKPAPPVLPKPAPVVKAPAAAKAVKGNGIKAASGAAPKKAAGSIRVDLAKLDSLMNLVGELVIAEAMVTRNPDLDGHEFENLEKSSHHLRRITSDLQDVAMSVRMVPLAGTFKKMVRLVHDTALKAGKKVNLELKGEETEVDKTVIEMISDPLVHIVRNAIDHGLENPEERSETDKSELGTVTIEARHESGEVWITVSDDGKGMKREVILNKAIEKGLVEGDGSDLRDEDVFKMVFEPGFSTAAAVTEISGRGVGMDVVKKNIEKINGKVDIKSTMGKGSQFKMRIPLTMAIIEGMLVQVGNSTYNIPLLSIREAFRPLASQVTTTPDGVEVVKLREDMIPVVRMHNMYGIEPAVDKLDEGILVIVENDGVSAALFVDEILGQQQTVVKGLSEYVGSPHGVSGCTILGDGRISLILDVATILANTATAPVAVV